MHNIELIVCTASASNFKQHELKSLTFHMQSGYTASHSAIHDFMNLKQEFEQMGVFKTNQNLIRMVQFKKKIMEITKKLYMKRA